MTTEELFAQMEAQAATEKEYCVIDPITREISVPEVYQKIGVVSDEKTNRIYFQCPRIVGDNVDLTKYGIRVNYQNANGQTKAYPVDDVAVSGDNITFSWLLDRPVTTYKGTINFVVCAIKTSGDEITNEWNTTLAKAEVLEGLEPDIAITEDEESIVELLVAQCTQKLTEMNMAIQTSENATNDAKTATQEAVNATEDARSVIEQITKDSYLHTALESFINEVTAKPTAYGNALVEKIEGYIRQTSTKGYQLFDSNILKSTNIGAVNIDNNGDGSFTIIGSGTTNESINYYINLSKESSLNLLKLGILYGKPNGYTNPHIDMLIHYNSIFKELTLTNDSTKSIEITNEMLESDDFYIRFRFYAAAGSTIASGTINPIFYQEGNGTWEPYTGGEPAPNPDYPQVIHGVGDMGFFDGEWFQGLVNSSSGKVESSGKVIYGNKIPCKSSDVIKLIYEETVEYLMVAFYKKDGTFIKSSASTSNVSGYEIQAPNESAYFIPQIQKSAGITPQSAKHITVTINGMYAVCIKSVGKNLSYHDKTMFSPLRCEYISDFGMLIQKTTSNTEKSTVKIQTYLNKNYVSHIISGLSFGKHSVKIQKTENFNFISVAFNGNAEDAYVPFYIGDIENGSYFYISFNFVSDEINKGIIEGLMITTEENTDFDFIPYQSNTTYVPISYPMFEGDQLIKRNMEYKILRKNGFAVFDGSEGEALTSIGVSNGFSKFLFDISDAVVFNKSDKVYCSNFAVYADVSLWTNPTKNACVIGVSEQAGRLCFTFDGVSSEEELKAWLQSNPIIVVYKFTTPIEEEFTPEAQKAIHSIMACDEQTKIEIVGVPTDVEVQNQFLLPRNIDGALNTTAFATSKRNEITLEEQAQQLATMVTQAITLAKAEV